MADCLEQVKVGFRNVLSLGQLGEWLCGRLIRVSKVVRLVSDNFFGELALDVLVQWQIYTVEIVLHHSEFGIDLLFCVLEAVFKYLEIIVAYGILEIPIIDGFHTISHYFTPRANLMSFLLIIYMPVTPVVINIEGLVQFPIGIVFLFHSFLDFALRHFC
jgi:hypothetical protein